MKLEKMDTVMKLIRGFVVGSWCAQSKSILLAGVLTISVALQCYAATVVTQVNARQRFPWNGLVDVDYTIEGEIPENAEIAIRIKDGQNGTSYEATSFSVEPKLTPGRHRAVWCPERQGVVVVSTNVIATVRIFEPAWYCVIDLSAGPSATEYAVSELDDVPVGGWTDEYKTTKLVLRRIEAGPDPCGRYSLTKTFYAGVFEVTQKQWELVMGANPSRFKGEMRPVDYVSYDAIRGSSLGAQWPSSDAVDTTSFLGKLRAKTGLQVDLPTEAQWEYACRAGTTTMYGYGDSANSDYMWYYDNSSSQTHEVGTRPPNGWGLYDMHGNVWEWCLDWSEGTLTGEDPVGRASGVHRSVRGGSWWDDAVSCTSSYRWYCYTPQTSYSYFGFRLICSAGLQ